MSLRCPYEGCDRAFVKQQGLIQHIQYRHPFIENEQKIQDNVSNDDIKLFQDNNLFEELNLFKKDLP